MSSQYGRWPPAILEVASFSSLPTSAADGTLAVTLDTSSLYIYSTTAMMWEAVGGAGVPLGIGTYDAHAAVANGLQIVSNLLYAQSATSTLPGMVNATTQTIGGNKTFTGSVLAANIAGSNTGDVTLGTPNGLSLGGQVLSLALSSTSTTGALSSTDWNTFNNKSGPITTGNLTDVGTDGITITGGTNAVVGSGTSISQHVADTTHNGYLSSTDWNTFNGKGSGTVTAVSVATSNGFAGSSTGGATPALTISTTITGLIKGNGTAISAATSGTDYSAGTSALATGILKSTTTTGALTIAVAGDFPTLNQSTTGTASNVTGTVAIANGGTGQTSKAPAFDALSPMTTGGDIIYGGASGTGTRLANGSAGQVLTSQGTTLAPNWTTPSGSPTGTYYSGFMSSGSSWTTTSGTYVDGTNSGGNALTQRHSNGLTVTADSGGSCGVNFSPASSSSVYLVSLNVGTFIGPTGIITVQLTDGTTQIVVKETGGANHIENFTMTGIFVPGTSSPVTVKAQFLTNGNSGFLEAQTANGTFDWVIVQIA